MSSCLQGVGKVCGCSSTLTAEEKKELETFRAEKAKRDAASAKEAKPSSSANEAKPLLAKEPSFLAKEVGGKSGDGCPEFINELLQGLWPGISQFVNKQIMETVQPLVKSKLPGMLQSSFSFDEKQCNLGTKAMQFPKMIVQEVKQIDDRGPLKILRMKTEILWESDMSVVLHLTGVNVCVKDLFIKGTMYIELVNLIGDKPFFEGYRAFFAEAPEVTLNFEGSVAGVSVGMLQRKIVSAVHDAVKDALVLPNRIGSGMIPTADIFPIVAPKPMGVLKVKVHKATGLRAMDHSGIFSDASSDPYVIVSLGPETQQSETISKNLNPEFNFESQLPLNMEDQKVRFQVWDEDTMNTDFLGSVELTAGEMIKWEPGKQVELKLKDDTAEAGKSLGSLMVSAEFRRIVIEKGPDDAGYVFVGVYNASQVRGEEDWSYWVDAQFIDKSPIEKEGKKVKPPATVKDSAEKAALKEKVEKLKKYKVPIEDIAEILEKDNEEIDPSAAPTPETSTKRRQKIDLQQPFHLCSSNISKVSVTLELKGCDAAGKNEKSFGKFTKSMAEVIPLAKHNYEDEIKLEESGAVLKLNMAVMFQAKGV